ncbi:TraB/GumN family protein [Scleromatobacter humisilvae]|uniref:TraB/GumN family protein n=1 Tax=Scleromatobacter humisilvae TaxID=2897159 RepID=A0A9X2C2D4_9BURK|nr:TraB/GumN family protein [Scleromatobacter humisilvae]MCK9685835.1 TraB/GumN family protein [Scleromatobacter humisilvae]
MSWRALASAFLLVAAPAWAAAVAEPGGTADAPAIAADVRCPPEAGQPTAEQAAAGMRAAVDSGLMWKATKGGRTVWLYGTIHVAKLSWAYPGPDVMHALMASDVVALELDVTDAGVIDRLRKAIERRPDAPALPEALQRRLAAQMAANCIAPDHLASLRPEMQAVTVDLATARQFGLYPEYGIDTVIAGVARTLRKPLRSLETPESQAALLVSDDPAETARTVGEVLDELEGGQSPQMLQRLAGDWQRGDLADLDAYGQWCDCLDTPEQRAEFVKLIDERNPLMADKIAKWNAEGKSLFVAVGSLHMTGRIGLPELLKARGFQVERVPFADAH